MPTWAGIEDATLKPERVWLWREKEEDSWKPLRKTDCISLNDSKDRKVLIEGGRYTADKEEQTIKSNFFRANNRYLTSAIWFTKIETNTKEKISLVPVSDTLHELQIEQLYQMTVKACSSFGDGIEAALQAEVALGEDYKAVVVQNGNVLSMKKKPTKGWFGAVVDLQRGYGPYAVKGEDIETKLGPVRHVIFVVHGIGEALWSRSEISMNSLATDMTLLRENLQQRQLDEWRKQCDKAKREGQAAVPKLPNRIEFVPVEWYDEIHGSSSTLMKTLDKATLSAVPAFRAIANHAVFDVLMYLTPAFCEQVLECVTSQITTFYNSFLEAHPDFLSNGGKVSLIGHSLGSVICWDLLSVLKENQDFQQEKPAKEEQPGMPSPHGVRRVDSEGHGEIAYQAYATHEDANQGKTGTWGPSLPKPMKQTIPFTPDYTIFLGSPLGMFLTLRGAHAVFDEMREAAIFALADKVKEADSSRMDSIEIPLTSPFTLPSKCIYNIFHPSDPVAYRIEPLLMSRDIEMKNLPPPMYLTSRGQDVRLHVKAKQVGDEIGRLFKGEGVLPFGVLAQVVTSVSNMGNDDLKRRTSSIATMEGLMTFALGGTNSRIDFQLQHGVIDNEYLSAVTAHSTYFTNSDFREFLCYLADFDN